MRGRIDILLGLVAGTPLVIGAIVTTTAGTSSPVQALAAIAAPIASPLAILDSRSPGARPAGVMQTKFAAAPRPSQRVLSQVRERPAPVVPVSPPGLSPAALTSLPVLGPGVPQGIGPVGPDLLLPASVGVPSAPVLVPLVSLPEGPGGNPGIPVTPVTPTPAVPEPVTWASLLTGLALIAGHLRFDRRRKAHLAPSTAR